MIPHVADIVGRRRVSIFTMSTVQPQQTNPWGFESLLTRFYDFIDSMTPSKRKVYGFGWLAIAAVLMAIASLPLGDGLRWVSAIVGSPSGVILFLLAVAVIHSTSLNEMSLFKIKQNIPPRKRVPLVAVGLIVVAATLIASSSVIPIGVGGSIVVAIALGSYNIIRRSPEELRWAAQGLPDPREIEES